MKRKFHRNEIGDWKKKKGKKERKEIAKEKGGRDKKKRREIPFYVAHSAFIWSLKRETEK